MGKSTVSMAIFNSFLYVYHLVTLVESRSPFDNPWLTSPSHKNDPVKSQRRTISPKKLEVPTIYPLVNIQKAIENGNRNSGFTVPIKHADFP